MSAADLEALSLTKAELRVLVYTAHTEAAFADDVRRYFTGKWTKEGAYILAPSWDQRDQLKARWEAIEAVLRTWSEEVE